MNWRIVQKLCVAVFVTFLLTACGGSSSPENKGNGKVSQKDTLPVLMIGPSTVYTPSELHEGINADGSDCRLEGWGQRLYEYATDPDKIYNYARYGANTQTFQNPPEVEAQKEKNRVVWYGPNRDHYWAKVVEKMQALKKGILLIQFGGSNHEKSEQFKTNIQMFIDKAKELHFTPVLITDIEKRIRLANGDVNRSRKEFPKLMKEIAAQNDVRILDLNGKSYAEYSKYSDDQWDEMFCKCYARWGRKKEDTHFEPKGAKIVASWIRDLACEQKDSLLCKQLQGSPKPFTLTSDNFIPDHGIPSLKWNNVPKYTKSFAVVIDDHDAVQNGHAWVHYVAINIPANTTQIKAGKNPQDAVILKNNMGEQKYYDPDYPNSHTYVAHIYALDIADLTKAHYINKNKTKILDSSKIYDHRAFEKRFANNILEKAEIRSR